MANYLEKEDISQIKSILCKLLYPKKNLSYLWLGDQVKMREKGKSIKIFYYLIENICMDNHDNANRKRLRWMQKKIMSKKDIKDQKNIFSKYERLAKVMPIRKDDSSKIHIVLFSKYNIYGWNSQSIMIFNNW